MKKTILICDKCGSNDDNCRTFGVNYDTRYNGVETETLDHTVDLCIDCAKGQLQAFLSKLTFTEAVEWYNKNFKITTIRR